MKKFLATFFASILVVYITNAQITVFDNNYVGIGSDTVANSMLSVNSEGQASWRMKVVQTTTSHNYGAISGIRVMPTAGGQRGYGVWGGVTSGNGYAQGVRGQAYNSTVCSSGRSYGVYGNAGNATSGYNYGVYGQLSGSNNGAAVFGTTGGDCSTGGFYAGYFYGDAKVTGTLYVGTTSYTSDENAKKDIKKLKVAENMDKLKQINAITYKYKTPEEMESSSQEKVISDTSGTVVLSEEMQNFYAKERVGFSAQEIQNVFPDLVSEDPSGLLGVDYIGMIPILLEAIKEQQAVIEELSAKVTALEKE